MDAGSLIRDARRRHRVSQRRLAPRAGTGQAAISRMEPAEISPSIETVRRLLEALGEELELGSRPAGRVYDPVHLRATRARSPAERLGLALGWDRFASELARAGRRARG